MATLVTQKCPSMTRSLGRRNRCQCKHHQQRLLQRQEMARQELKRQLAERGDQRHLGAINRHTATGTGGSRRPHTRLCTMDGLQSTSWET